MSNVQFWSIVISIVGTLALQVLVHVLGRGKIRTDEATALRKELREENIDQKKERSGNWKPG